MYAELVILVNMTLCKSYTKNAMCMILKKKHLRQSKIKLAIL